MKGNILVMTVCECLFRISIDVVWPFLSLYVLSLGGSYETVGIVMSAGNIASIVLYPVGGYIADFQGRIKIISYMTFLLSASFLIPFLTDTWQWLAITMLVQSLFTFYFPILGALRADSLPPDQRGIGYATVIAIPGAVGIASPLIGGWLIDTWGIHSAMKFLFLLGFAVGMLVAFIRLRFLVETLEKPNQIQVSVSSIPRLMVEAYRNTLEVVREVSRPLIILSLLISSCVFFVSLTSGFWLIRAAEVVGLSSYQWGFMMLVSGAINVLLSIPAGRLVDKYSKKWVAGVSLILGGLPTFLFLKATSFNHVMILAAVITLVNMFINPAFQTLFANMTPRRQRGRIMAAFGAGGLRLLQGAWGNGVVGMLAQTTGTFLSGYLYRMSISLPWIFLSVSLVILGVLFIVLIDEPEEPEF